MLYEHFLKFSIHLDIGKLSRITFSIDWFAAEVTAGMVVDKASDC